MWLTFVLACFVISISPGAGAVNTMSNGLQFGVRRTLPAILGLQLGYGVQVLIVGIGLGALLASSTVAFELVRWLGVAYLLWLGYKKWTAEPINMASNVNPPGNSSRQFWTAAFVNLTNPKATIFLLALFPQFIDPEQGASVMQYLLMALILLGVDVLVMIGYASLASQLSRFMQDVRHQRMQNRVFGGLFVGAASLMMGYRS